MRMISDQYIPAFQNFLALGSFASQLKTTIQSTDLGFEKACAAQTHLASQIQAYLSSFFSFYHHLLSLFII